MEEERGEGVDSDLDKRKAAVVAGVRASKRFWGRKGILAVIDEALADDRPLEIVERALLKVAADPKSMSPRRLLQDGPWWSEAAAELDTRPAPSPASGRRPVGGDEPGCGKHEGGLAPTPSGTIRCGFCRREAARTDPGPAAPAAGEARLASVINLLDRRVS